MEKLLESVGSIVRTAGFNHVGINNVASTAGVDKVLIYRYFGGLNGLLLRYIEKKDFYLNAGPQFQQMADAADTNLMQLAEELFVQQYRSVMNDPEFRAFLIWELTEKNEITMEIARKREQVAIETLQILTGHPVLGGIDIAALSALMLGGIFYIALRTDIVDVFNGIALSDEAGKARIEQFVRQMVRSIINPNAK